MQLDRVCLLLLLRTFLFQRGTPDERTEGSFDLAVRRCPPLTPPLPWLTADVGGMLGALPGPETPPLGVYGVARRWLAVKARGLLGEIVWSKGLVDS